MFNRFAKRQKKALKKRGYQLINSHQTGLMYGLIDAGGMLRKVRLEVTGKVYRYKPVEPSRIHLKTLTRVPVT